MDRGAWQATQSMGSQEPDMTDDLTQGPPKIQPVAFFKILYWITVDLQCCVSFKCAH